MIKGYSIEPSGQHCLMAAATSSGICLVPIRTDSTNSATDGAVMRDPYLDVVYQHRSLIVMLYERYADKKPVMLFDIQEQRIYAMPYVEYRAELSKRSQAFLKKQYERAIANGEIVTFVRDNQKQKLVSYSLAHRCKIEASRRRARRM